MSKKLAVFFPGRKYSVDCPLLYFADFTCSLKGYERAFLHYARHREDKGTTTVKEDIENAKAYVTATIQAKEVNEYDEVLFVSKSIGTVLAGYIREELKLKNVRNIYLTPLPETLPYIEGKDSIVIAGTKDRFLDKEELKSFCNSNNVKLYQFEGLGHSLETDDVEGSLRILKRVTDIIGEYIEQ
ncbi:MAG: hypothetical protein ACLRVQ_05985 [Lachnospiraceae bacterium]